MILRDILALIATFTVSLVWLRINDHLAQRGVMSSRTSRKVIHIGTGPLFILCWLLFSGASYVRFLAALVPLAITVQFILVGLGILKDEAAVQAMSRSGDPGDILRGPVYYGLVFVILTTVYWLDHPAGIVALCMLCGGDGLAEIIGRRYGAVGLPWNAAKSWSGSGGFLLGGWLLTVLVLAVFYGSGVFTAPFLSSLLPVTAIAFASALVESITPPDMDNLTVPFAAVVLGLLMF